MHHASLARASIALALACSAVGCAGTLPPPIYVNQLDAYFPAPGGDAAAEVELEEGAAARDEDPALAGDRREAAAAIRAEAERCAARLNGHRGTAEVVSILQGIISGIGGATSAAGGVLSAIDFGNPDITTAMGAMSAAGAGVTLAGDLLLGLLASPLEELRLHGLGRRSWDLAVELQVAGAEPEAVRASLARCVEDEGPVVRVVGAGLEFSF